MRTALTAILELLGMILLIIAGLATDWRLGLTVLGLLLIWQAWQINSLVAEDEEPT